MRDIEILTRVLNAWLQKLNLKRKLRLWLPRIPCRAGQYIDIIVYRDI